MTTTRAEFLAERKQGVGGSDIASVFSVGYGCALRLWREKRNEVPDFPREESGPMALGTFLEPFFRERFEMETGRKIARPNGFRGGHHPEHPEIRVNVDGLQVGVAERNKRVGILEIKSVGREVFFKIKREGLPEDYILQLQHGMLVTGAEWGSFCIGSRETGEILWWDAGADPEIQALILATVPEFWKIVQSGEQPPLLDPEDRRCQRCEYRVSCQGDALMNIPDQSMERDESLRPLVAEYWERKALKDEAEGLYEETKAEIGAELGNRTGVVSGGSKIYFRPQETRRKDADRLAVSYELLRRAVLMKLEIEANEKNTTEFLSKFPPAETMKLVSISRPLRVYGR